MKSSGGAWHQVSDTVREWRFVGAHDQQRWMRWELDGDWWRYVGCGIEAPGVRRD